MNFDYASCADQFLPRSFFDHYRDVEKSQDEVPRPISARSIRAVDKHADFINQLRSSILGAIQDGVEAIQLQRNIQHALLCLNVLPQDFPMPSPSVDEDGSVMFDWISANDVMFSVIVSSGKIIYSSYVRGQNDNAEFDAANAKGMDKFAELAESWLRQT